MSLDQELAGTGLVIGARGRLNVLPVAAGTRFADAADLAVVRAARPALRATPLAPVDLLDPTGMLVMIEDCSLDHVVDWAMACDPASSGRRIEAMARVLRPGGLLLLPFSDDRFERTGAEEEAVFAGLDCLEARLLPGCASSIGDGARWPFTRFAMTIAALAVEHVHLFELEQVRRHGVCNLALLRRRGVAPPANPCLAACEDNWYVLDGRSLRYIGSMDLLGRLRVGGVPVHRISRAERALFVDGPPVSTNDVIGFLARMDTLP